MSSKGHIQTVAHQRRERIHSAERNHRKLKGPGDMDGNSERMGTFGDWGRAAGQRVTGRGSGSFLRLKVTVVAFFLHFEYSYIPMLFKHSYFKILTTPAKVIREIKGIYSLMGQFQTNTYCCSGCPL